MSTLTTRFSIALIVVMSIFFFACDSKKTIVKDKPDATISIIQRPISPNKSLTDIQTVDGGTVVNAGLFTDNDVSITDSGTFDIENVGNITFGGNIIITGNIQGDTFSRPAYSKALKVGVPDPINAYTQLNGGGVVTVNFTPIDGSTLSYITFNYWLAGSSRTPTNKMTFDLVRYSDDNTVVTMFSGTGSAASRVASYTTYGSWTNSTFEVDQNNVINNSLYAYKVFITGESGAGSVNNNLISNISMTYTNVKSATY